MLGTVAKAREHGASGSDADVQAALTDATARANLFCRDTFEPVTEARVLQVSNGTAWANGRLRAVTTVQTVATTPVTIPATGYRLIPRVGAVSGLEYIGLDLASTVGDGLIAGAEPWMGGWAGLLGEFEYVTVTGDWGWLVAPAPVVAAVEQLAGYLAAGVYIPQADDEGNPSGRPTDGLTGRQASDPPPEKVAAAGRSEDTTGYAPVDRALTPYRRGGWRID